MGGPAAEAPAPREPATEERSLWASLGKLLANVDTIHLTLFGLALYVTVHFSYSIFYGRFGVSLGEVGLTYLEILTRSAPPLLALMTICVAIVLAGGRWLVGPSFTARDRYLLRTVVVVVFLVLVAGAVRAHQLAGLVQGGSPVRPRAFGEIIDIRVEYVTVIAGKEANAEPTVADPSATSTTVAPDPATGLQPGLDVTNPEADVAVRSGSTLEVARRRSLLYLGQANSVAVLYDAVQRQTIRIPIGEVTIFAE
jgi:hypothetical protein